MQNFTLCAFADEAGVALNTQIQALQENEISLLELRSIGNKNVTEFTPSEARNIKHQLDDAGIQVWSIGSPLGKISVKDDFEAHLDLFRHTLELGEIFNASVLRLFSFYIPAGENAADYRMQIFEQLGRMLDAAAGCHMLMCHENEKAIYGDTAERCLDLYTSLPALHAVFDPANFIQCKQDVFHAWKMLAPYITYLHIKDALPSGDVVPAGKGCGQLAQLLPDYALHGGKVLTIEPHLTVFSALQTLERADSESVVGRLYHYPYQRTAFDAAVTALREVIAGIK